MVSPKLMRTVQHLHDVGRCFCLEYRCLAVHVRFTHLQPSILSVTRYLLACLKFYRTSFAFGVDLFTFYWSLSQFYPRWNSLENYSAIFGTRTRFKSHTSVYARLRIENTLFRQRTPLPPITPTCLQSPRRAWTILYPTWKSKYWL